MTYNNELLIQIEEYAAALLSISEISILIGLSSDEALEFQEKIKNHRDSEVYISFNRGRLHTKYELRKKVIDLAKRGSPAAQPIAEKYMHENI